MSDFEFLLEQPQTPPPGGYPLQTPRFRIDQTIPGQDGQSRHDLIAGEAISCVVTDPLGAEYSYEWEILDQIGAPNAVATSNGEELLIGPAAEITQPCTFLIQLKVTGPYGTETDTRYASVRSEYAGLRIPAFGEQAPKNHRLSLFDPNDSTDNATYSDLAGLGAPGQNWAGWREWARELTLGLEDAVSRFDSSLSGRRNGIWGGQAYLDLTGDVNPYLMMGSFDASLSPFWPTALIDGAFATFNWQSAGSSDWGIGSGHPLLGTASLLSGSITPSQSQFDLYTISSGGGSPYARLHLSASSIGGSGAELEADAINLIGNWLSSTQTSGDQALVIDTITGLLKTGPVIDWGEHVPVVTLHQNLDSVVVQGFLWLRVGDYVIFAFRADVTAPAGGSIRYSLTLPIASNFTLVTDAIGAYTGQSTSDARVRADTSLDELEAFLSQPDDAIGIAQEHTAFGVYKIL